MIKFKFIDATIEAPDCWDDVLVSHFINPYFLSRDSVSLLASLSGIDRDVLLQTKADIAGPLTRMVDFIVKDPEGFTRKEAPKEFKLMGKTCKVPLDIELERVGQKIMFQDALGKHKFVYEGIPEAIAIYLIPELNDGKFDDGMIEEVAAEVRKLKIVDVFPLANFFLNSLKALLKNGSLY